MGEVVIRGPNVTPGYEANPEANAKAFTDRLVPHRRPGHARRGRLLRLTGRLKEIINRGGEKVSPLEVDEVLMDHPAVAQVVTFAMPHAKLGEEVAAAVVLREGRTRDEREMRAFAADRLADFKVPRQGGVPGRDPEGRHRQAAAHRPRRRSWGWANEDLHLRRRGHRRPLGRQAGARRGDMSG